MVLRMAWRNIWRNKMRSLVIMFSIATGLLAGIAVLSLYDAMMNSRVRTVIDSEVAHIQLHHTNFKKDYDPKYVIANGDDVLQAIKKMPQVKAATARSITTGMLATATGSAGVTINGIIPEEEYKVSQLKQKLTAGKLFDENKKSQVMIGKKLAVKMKLKPGSKLVLTFTDTSGAIVSAAFRVAAIYESANAPLDERNVYVRMNELNELLLSNASFHEIAVLLSKDETLKTVQQNMQQLFPSVLVESWKDISPETDLMVDTVDQYSYIIMIIIMLALAFGIINTMLMAILERTREIGMMMALGTNRSKLFILVLCETLLLTLAGTPIGVLMGWLLTAYFHTKGLDLSGWGKEMMSNFGFGTMIYPEFPAERLPAVLLIVTATALVSCLFPAVKALKLQPVEALRR
ncbi:ABC-type lipoprotein release transport system permease subunit [Lacibacter cauensis]|uniref:ABC-type lipoprotein release transport system permease subunit n=1 Tax=Lacibacter cauensis TaxID=510947 RepID=A0A562SDA9_9BACT|nr:FtsX-like permease family protein [Lacibacter cauensis]TWI79279.1 ABC-type lipoprotein release transport system permease subunit [Lacibacter cauensis]